MTDTPVKAVCSQCGKTFSLGKLLDTFTIKLEKALSDNGRLLCPKCKS